MAFDDSFCHLFNLQRNNQTVLLNKGMYVNFTNRNDTKPTDDPRLCSYHVQQLMSEIGEILDSDKRWKNFRNEKYDSEAKKEEIADCFIVLMNIAMFSGIDSEELYDAIESKIGSVFDRIKEC